MDVDVVYMGYHIERVFVAIKVRWPRRHHSTKIERWEQITIKEEAERGLEWIMIAERDMRSDDMEGRVG